MTEVVVLPHAEICPEGTTFEATPGQNLLRPGPVTAFKNLFLAGDWTDTGLPATIEGSVRSGDRAADLVLARQRA